MKKKKKSILYKAEKESTEVWNFTATGMITDSTQGPKALLTGLEENLDNYTGTRASLLKAINEKLEKHKAKPLSREQLRKIEQEVDKGGVIKTLKRNNINRLASVLKGTFITYKKWNSERQALNKPKDIEEVTWDFYIVEEEKNNVYCIATWIFNVISGAVTLITPTNKITGELNDEILHCYQGILQDDEGNQYRLFLNYPASGVTYIEGFLVSYTTQTQMIYNRVLLKSTAYKSTSEVYPSLSPITYYYSEYNKNNVLKAYFSKISKHIQETHTAGLKEAEDVISASKDINKPKKSFIYELYISSMASSGTKEQFEFCLDIGNIVMELLTTPYIDKDKNEQPPLFGIKQIYAPALLHADGKNKSYSEVKKAQTIKAKYKEGREYFHYSRHHMLLMPFNVRTAAYDQTTWCFYRSKEEMKRCVAIVSDQKHLSKLFTNDNYGERGQVIVVDNEFDTIDPDDHFKNINYEAESEEAKYKILLDHLRAQFAREMQNIATTYNIDN